MYIFIYLFFVYAYMIYIFINMVLTGHKQSAQHILLSTDVITAHSAYLHKYSIL